MSLCQYVVAICSHPSSSLATFIVLTYPQQDEIFCLLLILAAPPLDTRPCISRFALGPGFVYRKVTTCRYLCCACRDVLYLQTICVCRCRTTLRRGHRQSVGCLDSYLIPQITAARPEAGNARH